MRPLEGGTQAAELAAVHKGASLAVAALASAKQEARYTKLAEPGGAIFFQDRDGREGGSKRGLCLRIQSGCGVRTTDAFPSSRSLPSNAHCPCSASFTRNIAGSMLAKDCRARDQVDCFLGCGNF